MDAVLGNDCINDGCSALKSQSAKDVVACTKMTQVVGEDVSRSGEWLKELPGNVQVTYE